MGKDKNTEDQKPKKRFKLKKNTKFFEKNKAEENIQDNTSEDKKRNISDKKPFKRNRRFEKDNTNQSDKKPFKRNRRFEKKDTSNFQKTYQKEQNQPRYNIEKYEKKEAKKQDKVDDSKIRLNKYIANAGVCSRREADVLIQEGKITVNGKTITEMGFKVNKEDIVKYGNTTLKRENYVYVLLNKPKGFITTTDDPEDRKVVMDLVKSACEERIYPVGRLDRATSGLLLFTNDGDLSQKLMHPSHEISKIYQVELDKPFTKADFDKLLEGLLLEDGLALVDSAAIVSADKKVIGVEIHSGKNRIIRRMFEHLGYDVVKLDRTMYAGLDKRDLPRGQWRYLSEKEVIRLKFFT